MKKPKDALFETSALLWLIYVLIVVWLLLAFMLAAGEAAAQPPQATTPIKIKIKVYLEGALRDGAIIPQPTPAPSEPQLTERQTRLFSDLTDQAAQSIIDNGLIEKAADEILDLLREALSTSTGTTAPVTAPESAQGAAGFFFLQAQQVQADCLDTDAVKQAGLDRYYKELTARFGLSAVCIAFAVAKKLWKVPKPPSLKCIPESAADHATTFFIMAALTAGAMTPIGAASITGAAFLIGLTAYIGAELERMKGEDQARLSQLDQQAYNRCFNDPDGSCEPILRQRLLAKLKGKTDEAKRKTFDMLIEAERCKCGNAKDRCDQECGRPILSRPGTDISKIRKACKDGCGCTHAGCMSKALASYTGHVPQAFIDSAVEMNVDKRTAERCPAELQEALYECVDHTGTVIGSDVEAAELEGFVKSTIVNSFKQKQRKICADALRACFRPCNNAQSACYSACFFFCGGCQSGWNICTDRCENTAEACLRAISLTCTRTLPDGTKIGTPRVFTIDSENRFVEQ